MSAEARIVVVSDRAWQGIRQDATGPLLVEELKRQGYSLGSEPVRVVPDEPDVIEDCLRSLVADPHVRLVVTTGGTGPTSRDVTPEVTRKVVEKELPGFGELMRAESRKKTVLAAACLLLSACAAGPDPALQVEALLALDGEFARYSRQHGAV